MHVLNDLTKGGKSFAGYIFFSSWDSECLHQREDFRYNTSLILQTSFLHQLLDANFLRANDPYVSLI
jgi:hypothetical protein